MERCGDWSFCYFAGLYEWQTTDRPLLGGSSGSTYGAAGSLVIVLLWVYYSAMLFFVGAEFTKVYTKTFGAKLSDKLQPVPPTSENLAVNPSTWLPATAGNNSTKINL
jgi:hypothetical protein